MIARPGADWLRHLVTPTLLVLALILAAPAPAAESTRLPPDLQATLDQYRERIATEQPAPASEEERLDLAVSGADALRDGDGWTAQRHLQRLVQVESDFAPWYMLALASRDHYREDWRQGAALGALAAATLPEERALALDLLQAADVSMTGLPAEPAIGDVERERFEAALVADYPPVFAALRAEPVENSVPGTSCVVFSKALPRRGVAWADYVAIQPAPADAAISANGRRLCIAGLAYAQAYDLTVKVGLPSAGDRRLDANARFTTIVPDRPASLSFQTDSFVLPAAGRQVIPLESVNVERARIEVRFVTERALVDEIGERFPRNVGEWDRRRLGEESASLVGTWAVTIDARGNREVVTGIDLRTLVDSGLGQGLYLISAIAEVDGSGDTEGASQWVLVTDLAPTAIRTDEAMTVMVRSLATALPVADAEVTIIARNNRELAAGRTGEDGMADFAAPLLAGIDGDRPALVRVRSGTDGADFAVLTLSDAPLDLGEFPVGGRGRPGDYDAFLATERGIYRPGETVLLTVLLRDARARAVTGSGPLRLQWRRPDGLLAGERMVTPAVTGGLAAAIELPGDARTGRWTASLHLTSDGPAIGDVAFTVGDFVPPKIRVSAAVAPDPHPITDPLPIAVDARYTFGGAAGDLAVEALVEIVASDDGPEGYEDFRFGLIEEPFQPIRLPLVTDRLDQDGTRRLLLPIGGVPDTTHPLAARIRVGVAEPSGRVRAATVTAPLDHAARLIGVRPLFEDDRVSDGGEAEFRIVGLDGAGRPEPVAGLRFELFAEDWRWIWYRTGDDWAFEPTIEARPVASGEVMFDAGAETTEIRVPVDSGRYRLEVFDPESSAATSYRFQAGWWVADAPPNKPDQVRLTLPEGPFRAGETVRLHLTPPFAGPFQIMMFGETMHPVAEGETDAQGTTIEIEIPASEAGRAGVHLAAFVFRPGADDRQAADAPPGPPARALGMTWLPFDRSARELTVAIDLPQLLRPNREVVVPVRIEGASGPTSLRLLAVDDAVLGLTDFRSPDPAVHFFERQAFEATIFDVYARLIEPTGRQAAALTRTGGDAAAARLDGALRQRSSRVVALASAILTMPADGVVEVPVTLPPFQGEVRFMAIAWNADQLGSADRTVTVRDPVVVDLALPRFLAPGDRAAATLALHNVDGAPGDYRLSVGVDGPLEIGQADRVVSLRAAEKRVLDLDLGAGGTGIARILLRLEGPDGLVVEDERSIEVRPFQPAIERRERVVLAPGETVTLDGDRAGDLLTATADIAFTIGSMPTFGGAGHVASLLAFPYECLEQTGSRGFALASRLALPDLDPGERSATLDRLEDVLARVVALQRRDGGFALWRADQPTEPWLTVFVADFLLNADGAGLDVPTFVLDRALDWLSARTASGDYADAELPVIAYAHEVLARTPRVDISRLRHFADVYATKFAAGRDIALVAAALAHVGDRQREQRLLQLLDAPGLDPAPNTETLFTYGSPLRDEAMIAAVLADSDLAAAGTGRRAASLARRVAAGTGFTTQERAWLLRAQAAYASEQADWQAEVGGVAVGGPAPYMAGFAAGTLARAPVDIINRSAGELHVDLATRGVPAATRAPFSTGLDVARRWSPYEGDGPVGDAVARGTILVVETALRNTTGRFHQVLLADLLPAGLEIEEGLVPLLGQGEQAGITLLYDAARDDRQVVALGMEPGAEVTLAYALRAVTPGRFVVPPVYAESLYQSEVQALGPAGTITVLP